MTHNVGTVSAVLRPRSALRRLRVLAGEGPISMRKRP
jgi:hypothetical protein